MFRFFQGPADGRRLALRRAPMLLRVVIDEDTGDVDGLDLLDDEPRPKENVFVYRLILGSVSSGIACTGTRGAGCIPFVSADYVLHDNQPTDGQSGDRCRWREWCEAEAAKNGWVAA